MTLTWEWHAVVVLDGRLSHDDILLLLTACSEMRATQISHCVYQVIYMRICS